MKSLHKIFILIAGFFILCFIIALAYVSLLGENNIADTSVDRFFEQIKSKDYFSICNNTNVVGINNPFKTDGSCAENSFLFELALLKYFNLTNSSGYRIKIKKNHLWTPFFGKNSIKASLSLSPAEDSKLFSFFNSESKPEYIEDLFTIQRINGSWKLVDIDIQNPKIHPIFMALKKDLELSTYITKRDNKYIIKQFEIDTKNLNDIEKRKFEFISLNIKRIIMNEEL